MLLGHPVAGTRLPADGALDGLVNKSVSFARPDQGQKAETTSQRWSRQRVCPASNRRDHLGLEHCGSSFRAGVVALHARCRSATAGIARVAQSSRFELRLHLQVLGRGCQGIAPKSTESLDIWRKADAGCAARSVYLRQNGRFLREHTFSRCRLALHFGQRVITDIRATVCRSGLGRG
jgi:hypothetical protein